MGRPLQLLQELSDFLGADEGGRGLVNILAADRLMQSPRLYATFLLWLLSELFESLPEVGDLDKPKLVFFFDEAHLLFADAPDALDVSGLRGELEAQGHRARRDVDEAARAAVDAIAARPLRQLNPER